MEFNFDTWKDLAANNPEEFEARRAAEIAVLIASAPPSQQASLIAFQKQLDDIHYRYTPEEAMARMSSMMVTNVALIQRHYAKINTIADKAGMDLKQITADLT